jgi:hypothetical protein
LKTRNLLSLSKLVFFFLISGLILSCGKKPETVGLDLVDSNKAFVGNDTLIEVMVYSAIEDSIISDETTVNVIGSMQTPTFGLTNASTYSHLRISDPYPQWGPNPVADSIFLYMVYDTAYGNINTQQTFNIYRVTEDFYIDSSYYSNTSLDYDQNHVLAQHTFFPDLTPTLVIDSTDDGVDSSYLAAILKIPFNDWFADTIFNLDTSNFASNDAFIDKFKGIYIRPDDVNGAGLGAILSFNLLSENSYLAIHYHNDTTDSLSYKFLININNARIGKYEHNYQLSQDPNFINQVVNKDTTLGNTSLYLQGLGGIKMILRFPGLEEMAGSGTRVINEAKLIFKSEDYSDELKPPTTLYLFKYREDGSITTLLDQSEGENFFGGNFNANTRSYWFRIALEAQKILNDSFTFDGFVIYPSAKSIRPHELVMPGTNPNIPGHFRLEIIYTDTE